MVSVSTVADKSTVLTIPRGQKNLPPLLMDISEIVSALDLSRDLMGINIATYPQIISAINTALVQCTRLITTIDLELKDVSHNLEKAEAVVRLEKADSVISGKGLKTSADLRDAVVAIDLEVSELTNKKNMLVALLKYAENMKSDLERIYFSAKYVLDTKTNSISLPNWAGTSQKEG